MKVTYFKVIGLIGLLATELTAAAMDGKVTAAEGFSILKKVCDALGIDFDSAGVTID